MQSDASCAFATDDARVMDRTLDPPAGAFAVAGSVLDVTGPVCIDCLVRALRRSTGEVVDEVMALYTTFDVALSEAGHCHVCSRRTVVVD